MGETNSPIIIAFDADDTLWEHAEFYRIAEDRLKEILVEFQPPGAVTEKLREIELRNLHIYGFGVKGFTLTMLEAASDLAGPHVNSKVVRDILEIGHYLLKHPIKLFPAVKRTLQTLSETHRLILITRGDLFDQERKLAESGLRDYFISIQIVSNKTPSTYERIFGLYTNELDRTVMVGNSINSDIIPALEVGCWGVHIPQDITWTVEHSNLTVTSERYLRLKDIEGLVDFVRMID